MRLLLCANVRLGAECTEKLNVALSHKWRAERVRKFEELMDRAAMNSVGYIVLIGSLFGNDRITEAIIDSLFNSVKENPHIQVLIFLSIKEYERLLYRNDIPENLNIVCIEKSMAQNKRYKDSFLDDNVAMRITNSIIDMQLTESDTFEISCSDEGRCVLSGIGEDRVIPSFEPIGFDDARNRVFGYSIIECSDDSIDDYSTVSFRIFDFESTEVIILPTDSQREVLGKIQKEVSSREYNTFLRITLSGKSPFGMVFNSDALEAKLRERLFFVEVYDNTVMDIDEEDFENDISLRSEFVRLALQDDSLSEVERNRIISCGWNALGSKEVSVK